MPEVMTFKYLSEASQYLDELEALGGLRDYPFARVDRCIPQHGRNANAYDGQAWCIVMRKTRDDIRGLHLDVEGRVS